MFVGEVVDPSCSDTKWRYFVCLSLDTRLASEKMLLLLVCAVGDGLAFQLSAEKLFCFLLSSSHRSQQ